MIKVLFKIISMFKHVWPWTEAAEDSDEETRSSDVVVTTKVIDFVNLPEGRTPPAAPALWQRLLRSVFRLYNRLAPDRQALNRRVERTGVGLIVGSYILLISLFIGILLLVGLIILGVPQVVDAVLTALYDFVDQVIAVLPDPIVAVLGAILALPIVSSIWFLLALLGFALVLIAWRWLASRQRTTHKTRLDWLALPQVNVVRALDHLVGPTGNGNLDGGEVVVARITSRVAEPLAQIPEQLPQRVRPAWLHPTLIGIEATSHDRIKAVAANYALTLLVDESKLPETRPVLRALAAGWGALNERQALSGVGSATIQRIDPHEDGPVIDDNLAGGRGEPLHERQIQSLRGSTSPTAVIAMAPRQHIDIVQRKLADREADETAIEVRESQGSLITIMRLFLNNEFYWESSNLDEPAPSPAPNEETALPTQSSEDRLTPDYR